MYLTIQGLVLRVTNYNDHDALLSVLTHSRGKLTVKARGLRRKNSPLIAPCQLLTYSEFTLFEYRGMYTINEATAIELFHDMRKDLQLLSLGSYFAQVSEVLCQEDIPNPELLSLTLNCLYGISKLKIDQSFVKAVFELRSACIAGYAPDLHGCVYCGSAANLELNVQSGHLVCRSCGNHGSEGICVPISQSVLESMRYICACPPKKLFFFRVGEESLVALTQVAEVYLASQLERGFSALDFYKSLLYETL